MTTHERPRQIIDYCLEPLHLDPGGLDTAEAYRRLEHVLKTFQLAAGSRRPVAVDFSRLPTVTINEAAHGDA